MARRGVLFAKPDAVEVIPGLFIGSAPDRRSSTALARAGVSRVVDLRMDQGRAGSRWPEAVDVEICGLAEYAAPSAQELHTIAARIAELMNSGAVVFVHCREGIQRAPMVACAVLVETGWSLADAYRLVKTRRPVTAMSEAQLGVLREVESICRQRAQRRPMEIA